MVFSPVGSSSWPHTNHQTLPEKTQTSQVQRPYGKHNFYHCAVWIGSLWNLKKEKTLLIVAVFGSKEPYYWLTDPDRALFISGFQDVNKNISFLRCFFCTYYLKTSGSRTLARRYKVEAKARLDVIEWSPVSHYLAHCVSQLTCGGGTGLCMCDTNNGTSFPCVQC